VDAKYPPGSLAHYRQIAVAPLAEGTGSAPNAGVCRLAGLSFNDGPVEAGAGMDVADLVWRRLDMAGLPIAAPEKTEEALAAVGADIRAENGIALAKALAARTGADVALLGCVARYQELDGAWYYADRPAAVAFGLVAVDAASGDVVWAGKFEEKQRSLFADLTRWRIFWAGGLVWQRAQKLAGVGVDFLAERMTGR